MTIADYRFELLFELLILSICRYTARQKIYVTCFCDDIFGIHKWCTCFYRFYHIHIQRDRLIYDRKRFIDSCVDHTNYVQRDIHLHSREV